MSDHLFWVDRDGVGFCKPCGHPILEHDAIPSMAGCQLCNCLLTRGMIAPHQGIFARILDDGRYAVLYRLITGYKILVGPLMDWNIGGDDVYEYRDDDVTEEEMKIIFLSWDGYGLPERWYRHKIGQGDRSIHDGWTRRAQSR